MTQQPVIRIVDDDPSIHDAMDFALERRGWKICHYFSAERFLADDFLTMPGCIILDVRMEQMSGLALQRKLREASVNLPVIFLTGHGTIDMAVDAMEAGAVTFLTKPVHTEKLVEAIEKALSVYPGLTRQNANALRIALESLSDREREVAQLVAKGKSNKAIAEALGIALRTVEFHRAGAMRKLSAHKAGELKERLLLAEGLSAPTP